FKESTAAIALAIEVITESRNSVFGLRSPPKTQIRSYNILYAKVEDESFEDIEEVEGMATVADNRSLKDPAIFKGIIDENYLRGFLSASYTEKVEYDENSPINQFREIFGLNKQGKITSKVSMFANPYPFESALKFWGAVKGCGAQNPAKPQ
ncbi:MAG: hypothetical protein J6S98_08135, partial [Lentisphaeria bacterium]|nr:hypothetical protein [Lentisphaeria bacterium]